jgi:hypothetical protein
MRTDQQHPNALKLHSQEFPRHTPLSTKSGYGEELPGEGYWEE